MWKRRLLKMSSNSERGSAVVESVAAISFILLLVLGTVQVALTLYARNIVMSAVHDGARSAVEIGGTETDAAAVASASIARSTGTLVENLRVDARTRIVSDRYLVRVVATGLLDAPGPVPLKLPIAFNASTSREVFDADTP